MYVCVDTEEFELLCLYVQVVFQLTLRSQEIGLVLVVEPQLVLGQGAHQPILNPVSEPISSEIGRFHLDNTATSQQEELHWEILELSQVPNPGGNQKERAVEAEAGPVPDHVQGVQDVVEDEEGGEGLIWDRMKGYRRCRGT